MSESPMHHVQVELDLKNMVSKSCIRLVRQCLEGQEGLRIHWIQMGKALIDIDPKLLTIEDLEKALKSQGFPIIRDPDRRLVEAIKVAAIELIHQAYNANSLIRNSAFLEEKVGQPYAKLSKTFSDLTGTTLEQYLILLKIEKVKELITYEEHTMSEISYMMGYSSVQYMSTQFRKVTGYTPSEYKKLEEKPRIPLEELLKQSA